MSRRLTLTATILTLILLSACVLQPDIENVPDVGIPIQELNSQVIAFAPKGWNTFKIDDPIMLEVYVKGEKSVIFPPDFGIRVFLYHDGRWIEVIEKIPVIYPYENVILSPASGTSFPTGAVMIYPKLPEANRPILLRIFVFGHTYSRGKTTDQQVAAYVDVVLFP